MNLREKKAELQRLQDEIEDLQTHDVRVELQRRLTTAETALDAAITQAEAEVHEAEKLVASYQHALSLIGQHLDEQAEIAKRIMVLKETALSRIGTAAAEVIVCRHPETDDYWKGKLLSFEAEQLTLDVAPAGAWALGLLGSDSPGVNELSRLCQLRAARREGQTLVGSTFELRRVIGAPV